jgi:glycosyltransferase involved in cell wall biosynthesis
MSEPVVCLLSITPVTREARLLRQADALRRDGWQVIAAGLACDQPSPEGLRVIELAHSQPDLGLLEEWTLRRKFRRSGKSHRYAEDCYWRLFGHEAMFHQLAYIEGIKADIVVGHEYFTAPLAARLARHWSIPFALDIHEYATEQYASDPEWRRTWQPYVRALEGHFLPQAAAVTTVCDGIADALHRLYGLRARPLVVRSTSLYAHMPFRPTGGRIDVLYHGLVSPLRGLERTIESVRLWRPEFRLVIRGIAEPDYSESLIALAERHGVRDRVEIQPGVLLQDMVRLANGADIGLFVQEDVSLHKHHTLPNKLFEYIMAGLAVCVSDLPEMARVVRDHRVGRLVPELSPQAIANVINSFSRDEIDACKRRSLEAARVLCWEVESRPMLDAYRTAIGAV